MNQRIVVVGGSAAGPKAAAKARRMNPEAEIIIVQKAKYLSMASCGYPYYVAGVFDDRNKLISTGTGTIRDPQYFLVTKGIEARVQTEAITIDRENKILRCKNLLNAETYDLPYDQLILTTGATPVRPPLPGIELQGITTLQSMEDADFLRSIRDEKRVKKAVVIGGG